MDKSFKKIVYSLLLGILCFGSACNDQRAIETIQPKRGKITESFNEPAYTRLSRTHNIVMPVAARISRIELEPGDKVSVGQLLTKIDMVPFEQAVVEARSQVEELKSKISVIENFDLEKTLLAQTKLMADAASKALQAEEAKIKALQVRVERTSKERDRLQSLKNEQAIALSALDDVRLTAETATIELRQEEFQQAAFQTVVIAIRLMPTTIEQYISRRTLEREATVCQLHQAKSQLMRVEHDYKLAQIASPIDGIVLEKYHQGDTTLTTGTPLLLLGNMTQLEAVAEVLTQDALRLAPGNRVLLQPAYEHLPIDGQVRQIEPMGFTKLSSLGVEQQRVRVIISFSSNNVPLGVGYRLQCQFITRSRDQALLIPRFSVLQDTDQSFYVLKLVDNILVQKKVVLGLRSEDFLEVLEGVSETDKIVAKPDTSLAFENDNTQKN